MLFSDLLHAGVTATVVQEFGFSNTAFMKNGKQVYEESWSWINSEQQVVSLFGVSAYALFAGFSVNIGFNFL